MNLKFHRDFSDSLIKEPEDRELLDVGSCGLHSVNGAFKTGMKATPWKISECLSGLYFILMDTPARRGDYPYYSGSKLFPQKFCTVRWLETVSSLKEPLSFCRMSKTTLRQSLRTKKPCWTVKTLREYNQQSKTTY